MSANILILGGTRFVGRKLLKLLEQDYNLNIFVASRREINTKNFFKIDRKNPVDLERVFTDQKFDIVVDFINFSASDSQVLVSALKKTKQEPHLINISTVYVYNNPNNLVEDRNYKEEDFNPQQFKIGVEELAEWDYTKGKQAMEAYLSKNYPTEKSTTLRFPIILGEDDYTKRSYFFREVLKSNEQISLSEKGGKANYIFSDEAAEAIFYFIKNNDSGVYNAALEETLDEKDILKMYCEFYDKNFSDYLDHSSKEEIQSPFFYKKNFLTDSSKFRKKHTFNNFKECLFRELKKMEE